MPDVPRKSSVVVIGGGTGTHAVLRGLKRFADRLDITAIVTMADSGGSTGRLRDDFGYLPVGDVRMALAALASDVDAHEELMRELFLYRFENGNGLAGHNFGNLFLTALTGLVGSEAEAVRVASRILRVRGTVLPVTTDNVHLTAVYDDGTTVTGEHAIDDPPRERYAHRITALGTTPHARVTDEAAAAIRGADLLILGPGDLYSSLLANCVVEGVATAIAENRGTFVYVSNLMERPGQTYGMSVCEHLYEVERYVGRHPDTVLMNDAPLPVDLLAHYRAADGSRPVRDDAKECAARVVRFDLLARETVAVHTHDIARSLIRHDADRLAAALLALL